MLIFISTIVLDISLGVAWWVTKQITYHTINTITTYIYPKPMLLLTYK